jgi:hypothetical protein
VTELPYSDRLTWHTAMLTQRPGPWSLEGGKWEQVTLVSLGREWVKARRANGKIVKRRYTDLAIHKPEESKSE